MSRFFDDLETQLTDAARREVAAGVKPRRRPLAAVVKTARRVPPRWRRTGALGAVAAVAGMVAAAVLLTGGSGGIDVVAKARAALAPRGQIVHMRWTIEPAGCAASASKKCRSSRLRMEQWSTDDPYRARRIIRTASRFGGPTQVAYADGKMQTYSGHVLRIERAPDPPRPLIDPPLGRFEGIFHGDAAAALRRMLAQGTVHDAGTAQVDGRPVRRLVGHLSFSRSFERVVYDVDRETFAPVDGTLTFKSTADGESRGGGFSSHFRVTRYERIDLTPETSKLLTITPKPGTNVAYGPRQPCPDAQAQRATGGTSPLASRLELLRGKPEGIDLTGIMAQCASVNPDLAQRAHSASRWKIWLAANGRYDCFYFAGPGGTAASGGCGATGDPHKRLRHYGATHTGGGAHPTTTLLGIVPDGVSHVTVVDGGRTIDFPVQDNAYVATGLDGEVSTLSYTTADGKTHTFPAHPAE